MEDERQQEGRSTEDSKERAASEKNLAGKDKVSYPETTTQMIGWKRKALQRNGVVLRARSRETGYRKVIQMAPRGLLITRNC